MRLSLAYGQVDTKKSTPPLLLSPPLHPQVMSNEEKAAQTMLGSEAECQRDGESTVKLLSLQPSSSLAPSPPSLLLFLLTRIAGYAPLQLPSTAVAEAVLLSLLSS